MIMAGHLNNNVSAEPNWIIFVGLEADGSLTPGFGFNDTMTQFTSISTFSIDDASDDERNTAMLLTPDNRLLGIGLTDESAAQPERITFFRWK